MAFKSFGVKVQQPALDRLTCIQGSSKNGGPFCTHLCPRGAKFNWIYVRQGDSGTHLLLINITIFKVLAYTTTISIQNFCMLLCKFLHIMLSIWNFFRLVSVKVYSLSLSNCYYLCVTSTTCHAQHASLP